MEQPERVCWNMLWNASWQVGKHICAIHAYATKKQRMKFFLRDRK